MPVPTPILSTCTAVRTLLQTVSIYFLVTVSCSAQTDPNTSVLPGFDYWSLTSQVTQDPRIAEELDISPTQIKAIENLRCSKHMHDAFREKSKEVALRRIRDRKSNATVQGSMELGILESDDLVKAELSKILNESQVTLLRAAAMRQKYRFGYSPFYDPSVAEFCNVSRADQGKLADLVESAKERLDKELKDARFQLGSAVAASLPAESQKRFACYVGDAYLPGFKLPLDFDLNCVPHRKEVVLAMGAFETICESSEFRAKLGLSQQQCNRLLDASEEREKALTASRENDLRNYLPIWLRTAENCVKLLRDTLTPAQALAVCQSGSLREFNSAFETPFARHEVIEYLQLREEEARAVRVLSKEKQRELRERVAKLNRATFDFLCNTLPRSEQERFRVEWHGFKGKSTMGCASKAIQFYPR